MLIISQAARSPWRVVLYACYVSAGVCFWLADNAIQRSLDDWVQIVANIVLVLGFAMAIVGTFANLEVIELAGLTISAGPLVGYLYLIGKIAAQNPEPRWQVLGLGFMFAGALAATVLLSVPLWKAWKVLRSGDHAALL